jgi:hypothetical protein
MVEDITAPMVLQKLLEYVTLLVDRRGRTVFEINSQKPHLAMHPWQDIQHILSAFLSVATSADLYNTVTRGGDIGLANYANALAVADRQIQDLRAILYGNGLGKFNGLPYTAPWFSPRQE